MERHGCRHLALRHDVAIHLQRDVHRSPDFVGQFRFDLHFHLARRQLVFGPDLRALDLEQVELVTEDAVLHIAGDAAGKARQRVEHAIGVLRHVQIHGHNAVDLAQFGCSGFRHPGHGAIEGPFGEGRGGGILRMEHRRGPQSAADGQVLVLRGFEQEEGLHLLEFLRIRRGKVVRLAPILIRGCRAPTCPSGATIP